LIDKPQREMKIKINLDELKPMQIDNYGKIFGGTITNGGGTVTLAETTIYSSGKPASKDAEAQIDCDGMVTLADGSIQSAHDSYTLLENSPISYSDVVINYQGEVVSYTQN
jgi:hypothetical protein